MALGLAASVGRPQPARAATGDNLVLVWNEETLEAIRTLSPGPTVAVRALAVVHTAIYDAWAAYDPVAVGTRLGANLRRPTAERTQANKERAVSFAAYLALVDLFPARQAAFDQRMATLGYATDGSDTSTAATVGTTAGPGGGELSARRRRQPAQRHADTTRLCAGQHLRTSSWTLTAGSRCVCPCRRRGRPSAAPNRST